MSRTQADTEFFENQNVTLKKDVERANSIIDRFNAETPAPSSFTVKGKPIDIPNPPTYDGDRTSLENFVSKLRAKLIGEDSRFLNEQHKMAYVYGLPSQEKLPPGQRPSPTTTGRRRRRCHPRSRRRYDSLEPFVYLHHCVLPSG